MQRQSAFRSRLILWGFALGFLGLLAAIPSVRAQAALCQPLTVASQSASMRTEHVDFSLPEDPSGALEDSIETFRIAIEQGSFGIDRLTIGPKVVPKVTRNSRPIISPPLLV